MADLFGAAMHTAVAADLSQRLEREDGQEDLCFAVWHPSVGARRETAVIRHLVPPADGDRQIHGNVSFNAEYFMRAADAAADEGGGLALIHSHPFGRGWQGLSDDDEAAEATHAGRAQALTGRPLVGLTLATGDGTYSARRWIRNGPRTYKPQWAESVRVVGDRWVPSWNPARVHYEQNATQVRTLATWGESVQASLDAARVGVIGLGSVGSLVVEALARIGVGSLCLVDYDTVKPRNLDRLVNARRFDAAVGSAKAVVAARGACRAATSSRFTCDIVEASVFEPEGLMASLDCDLIFSCVDRPAARATLNAIAYAHLVPVIDGGVLVDATSKRIRSAQWRSHVAAPGRRCLECLGQYDPALVQSDRDGLLDDPSYLARLPEGHVLGRGENVFAFSAAAAAAEVLAALRMVIAPGGYADAGAQHTHFTTGDTDSDLRGCDANCPYPELTARGSSSGLPVTSRHIAAEVERTARRSLQSTVPVRLLRAADRLVTRTDRALERLALNVLGSGDR